MYARTICRSCALRTSIAPGPCTGLAFGRAGCSHTLLWQADYGTVGSDLSPLAHQWVGNPLGVSLHPTELYEMAAEIINFLVLYWLVRHKKFEGQVIGLYLIFYGMARYFIEFFRGDTAEP